MDGKSTSYDFLSGIKPISQVCQEYEALLKIKQITEKEIADMFIKAYGSTAAAMHIHRNFSAKVAKAILAEFKSIN